ncbi:alanine--glyoxylate aminotransferase-like isoform X2 [Paramormyrops kingsleyae]|uniref:alanine--glyoxylate aminotransferase-like isoform X2 n=1 Tax=Paramormyrops kingsleyae TaxID=1676925 RepID=UPI000CD5DDED|nr:serine--pyruvate aminotransferase, mitochondrial-like isoform X2 [Paramormyrops kingsleyae]
MSSLFIPPPACLLRPLEVPHRYLFGPGPSNVSPRVQASGARQMIGHLHREMLEIMDDIKKGIQYAFQTQNSMTIAIRARVNTIVKLPGGYFTNEEIEQALYEHKPVLFFLTHGESSSGVVHPLDGIGELCHNQNCLFLVDAVASLGGSPIVMDKQGIDVLYTASQKVLSSPPGTAPISFSEGACKKIFNRKTKPVSFLLDMSWLANYWGCDGKPARMYHHTGPISGLFALRESLAALSEMGLEKSWTQHNKIAEHLHKGLESLGLKLFVQEKSLRLPTITTIAVPPGYDWREIIGYIMKHHNIEISGGLGSSSGMVLRIGLMGYNCNQANADMVLMALRDALKHCHKSKV